MCGLVSVATMKENGFSIDEGSLLDQSMILNQWRGEDSTGLVSISNTDAWMYAKAVGGYRALQKHPGWNELRKNIMNEGRLVFGHGRWATKGNINTDNAHPFHIKREDGTEIIFVHNGTLDTRQDLPRFFDYAVDSEWLGNMIAEKGAEEALSSIYGAIACMWWDTRDLTFNFYRNHERPLYYMYKPTGEFYLNSERMILEWTNFKFGLKIPDKNIWQLSDKKWHKCRVNGDATNFDIVDIKPRKRVHVVHNAGHNWPHGWLSDVDDDDAYGVDALGVGAVHYGYNVHDHKPAEIKAFWDRDHTMIEYIDGKKKIQSRNNVITIHHNVTPPEPGLLRVYELGNGDIQKVYAATKQGDPCTFVTVRYDDWVKLNSAPPEEVKEAKKEESLKPPKHMMTKDGVNLKFSTRMNPNNVKIKHNGILNKKKGYPFLETYTNSHDGTITVGTKVYVEVLYTEERDVKGNTMLKVMCARVKEDQDFYIDLQFWTSQLTKEQLNRERFYEGTVAMLAVQDKDKIKETGAWIIGTLKDVRPILEPTNEQAANVQTQQTTH